MLKKLINLIVIFLFWSGLYLGFYWLSGKFGAGNGVYSILFGIFTVFLFISIVYKSNWYKSRIKKNKLILILFFTLLMIISGYGFSLINRSYYLFSYMKSQDQRGWFGQPHHADSVLGLAPTPGARAWHVFPYRDKIPMAYDADGFRVPVNDTLRKNIPDKTDLLFLGCSFTYGDACYADSTFSEHTAKALNMNSINAGVCSYGLSQVFLRSQTLIPKYKPRFVIVQYSPWLVERSISVFAPVYFGTLPGPYFYEKKGEVNLQLPLYRTQVFDLDKQEIQKKYSNSFLSFIFNISFKFYWNEDIKHIETLWKKITGKMPEPAKDKILVEKFVYTNIIAAARANGSIPIILKLGFQGNNVNFPVDSSAGYILADADKMLGEYLKTTKSRDYGKEFNHWAMNGKDSVMIDTHPNPLAHRLIAEQLIQIIKKQIK